jgi:hypothetical protein
LYGGSASGDTKAREHAAVATMPMPAITSGRSGQRKRHIMAPY